MSATDLASDLRTLGLACVVEARDRLAVLRPRGDVASLAQPDARAAVLRAARARGFTHVALELDGAGDAPVSRD